MAGVGAQRECPPCEGGKNRETSGYRAGPTLPGGGQHFGDGADEPRGHPGLGHRFHEEGVEIEVIADAGRQELKRGSIDHGASTADTSDLKPLVHSCTEGFFRNRGNPTPFHSETLQVDLDCIGNLNHLFFLAGDISLKRSACQSSERLVKFAVLLRSARAAQRSAGREMFRFVPLSELRASPSVGSRWQPGFGSQAFRNRSNRCAGATLTCKHPELSLFFATPMSSLLEQLPQPVQATI